MLMISVYLFLFTVCLNMGEPKIKCGACYFSEANIYLNYRTSGYCGGLNSRIHFNRVSAVKLKKKYPFLYFKSRASE